MEELYKSDGIDLDAERLIETDNHTYDLTFEDRGSKIVVYIYDYVSGDTEVYDIINKAIDLNQDYIENFEENVERYIREIFGVEYDREIEL